MEKLHDKITEIFNHFEHHDDLIGIILAEEALKLSNVSPTKNELIQQLLDKIHDDSDNTEKLEYQSKIACGYGIVTIDIKVE